MSPSTILAVTFPGLEESQGWWGSQRIHSASSPYFRMCFRVNPPPPFRDSQSPDPMLPEGGPDHSGQPGWELAWALGLDSTLIPFLVRLLLAHASRPDWPTSVLGDQEVAQQGPTCLQDSCSPGLLLCLRKRSLGLGGGGH